MRYLVLWTYELNNVIKLYVTLFVLATYKVREIQNRLFGIEEIERDPSITLLVS